MYKHEAILFKEDAAANRGPLLFTSEEDAGEKDRKVWNAFRASNREAFDYIFREHTSKLFAYGSKFTKDEDLVLDCIQDLFVGLWNSRQRLSETSNIKFYLLKALRHRLVRTLHKEKRLEAIAADALYLEETVNFSIEQVFVLQETEQFRKANLRRAIEGLTKRQREAVYLKFFQGLNNEAIGLMMDLELSSVNTLLSQSIRALRAIFD
jgi:RNA polymerase sigma factor (sigma-70 family)